MLNQVKGVEAEQFVMNYFRSRGFNVYHIDDYYDIEIEKNGIKHLIEIKSCQFRVRDGGLSTRYGRFIFDKKSSRIKQRTNNVRVIFVLNIDNSYEIIGMRSARNLKQQSKYLSLKSLMDMSVFHVDAYIRMFDR